MKRTNSGDAKKTESGKVMTRALGGSDLSDEKEKQSIDAFFAKLVSSGRLTEKDQEIDPNADKEWDGEEKDDEFTFTEQQELEFVMMTQGRQNAGLDNVKYEKTKKKKMTDLSPESSDDEISELSEETKKVYAETTEEIKQQNKGNKKYDNDDYEERELKPWGEKGFQGTLGENYARKAFESKGLKTIDLNELALNFGGLDNISNDPNHPFEQTKLHLAETTANANTYAGHLDKAGTYAVKAVAYFKKHEEKFKKLIESNDDFKDHTLLKTMLSQLSSLEGVSEDDIKGTEVHETVTNGMLFSVPSDIYAKIDKTIQHRFISLGKTVEELKSFKQYMSEDFTPSKKMNKKTEEEKDEDYDDTF